mmetsp:Transcript_122456/g.305757  ORF Transcript_122456/g.305757 Transcript_122456/m.305757 type:complete len:205 (+) Transcript_122456:133-747(+)
MGRTRPTWNAITQVRNNDAKAPQLAGSTEGASKSGALLFVSASCALYISKPSHKPALQRRGVAARLGRHRDPHRLTKVAVPATSSPDHRRLTLAIAASTRATSSPTRVGLALRLDPSPGGAVCHEERSNVRSAEDNHGITCVPEVLVLGAEDLSADEAARVLHLRRFDCLALLKLRHGRPVYPVRHLPTPADKARTPMHRNRPF